MPKIEFKELAIKLGVSKRAIYRLVYMKGSTLRYTEEDGKRFFNEEEVLELLAKGR